MRPALSTPASTPTPTLTELATALEQARLRGHGGAGFPTATKLHAVAAARGRRRPVVVINGAEGEPLSRKDRFLLGSRTGTILDGALLAARALDASAVLIAIEDRREATLEAVRAVLAVREDIHRRGGPRVEVVPVPAGFVTGQETALVSALNGRAARPTLTPPYPFERGVRGAPTLVVNAETCFHIAEVVAGRHDASRFITVSGAVAKTTVLRVAPGASVGQALTSAGGVTDRVGAILLGGYGGTWAAMPEALDLPLDEARLRPLGLTLGAGIVHVLGASQCPVAEVARITRWMAGESAGQCGPCVFGLDAIATALEALCGTAPNPGSSGGGGGGRGGAEALAQLERWCQMVTRRGACAHPDGVARFVTSALGAMASDFRDHAAHGPCPRCASVATDAADPTPASLRSGALVAA